MTKVYVATKNDLEQIKANFNANDITNVGYITWQMCLMRNYLKLNGMPLVNASVDYADLLQFAVDHELITTDVNDKALFKYDETEDVLTLPDYMDLCLQGGTMVKTEKAGLPNITGGSTSINTTDKPFMLASSSVSNLIEEGALVYRLQNINITWPGGGQKVCTFDFDASRSNATYGASTTVQPPAIKLIPQIKYRRGADGQVNYGDGTPLGTVIMFMGTVAPADYLFCDGTLYNVADYPKFAVFIAKHFGSVNYFGGDGETTFAVPDLRGEFLRCTGTNSHTNQGNGAAVGTHQDGTIIPNIGVNSNASIGVVYGGTWRCVSDTADKYVGNNTVYYHDPENRTGQHGTMPEYVTIRTTNTSVMYCIKAKTGDEQ